ncbi:hypothetical protein TSUD_372970 [Trifolium subterraneum]|uniref:Aminotransferase-like plant mobile domain-containing protein n=1 Tax=Trifolium subterraneum TaxID=3900 RepID=A0A2Z6P3R2_TRISU|nr:hypothetical protein TSUD_372970 [Trifolium subterraneum]
MKDEVGRQRGGRESRAHSSTRREATLGPSKRIVVGSTSGAQLQEPEAEHPEPQPVAEEEAQEDVEAQLDDREDEEEQNDEVDPPPPPPAPKQTKRNRRTTTARNPPKAAEPQVTEFGGGPSDLSLLPSFGNHVAAALWRGECGERTLKCMNPGKRINSLDKPETDKTWFWDRVEASGLRPLLKTNYNHVGSGLLTAFTERWQLETGTFHLPIGEMTITLDDVSCLLHIPIMGKMLNHAGTSCTMEEGQDMCEELLTLAGKMLRKTVNNEDEEAETVEFLRDCTVRAFLLYLIDIPLINTWNWGASGLAYMYNYLDRASRRRCGNHGGYNCMNFAHFKRYEQRFLDENYTNEDPVGAKYYALRTCKWPYEMRTSLDRMKVDEVTFCPYEDHRQTRPF